RDYGGENGQGFIYKGKNLLFESALMIGDSESRVSNNARNGDDADEHFVNKERVKREEVNDTNGFQAISVFTDEGNPSALKIEVTNKHIAFPEDNHDYILVEYEVKNTANTDLENIHVGLFTDWDIDESDKNITK